MLHNMYQYEFVRTLILREIPLKAFDDGDQAAKLRESKETTKPIAIKENNVIVKPVAAAKHSR